MLTSLLDSPVASKVAATVNRHSSAIPTADVNALLNTSAAAGASTAPEAKTEKIMIVDDEPINVKVVQKYLQSVGYSNFFTLTDSTRALSSIRQTRPDIVLLDIVMPEVSGLEILEHMRDEKLLTRSPVLILTASSDADIKLKALDLGAMDFLAKPVDPSELVTRVRNSLIVQAHQKHLEHQTDVLERLVEQRTAELVASRYELIHCLARAAEYRDNETGKHVLRVGKYVGIIADELGFEANRVKLLELAAPLHDVGKIGISDNILLKPGKLEPSEYDTIKKHCGFGTSILQPMTEHEWHSVREHTVVGGSIMDVPGSPIIETAGVIAQTHHEKWDGSGYPLGLAGENIPIEGRITAVADVFDALSSARPYKEAFPLDKCFRILKEGSGTHFDPRVLAAFFARQADIVDIQIEYSDVNE